MVDFFKDTHFVAEAPVELNNPRKTFKINLNIILYHNLLLNI